MNNETYSKKFSLLKSKEIYAILDGDKEFGDYKFSDGSTTKIALPYLTGGKLINISRHFGITTGIGFSRWKYVEDILTHVIKKRRVSEFLKFLFSINQFEEKLNAYSNVEIKAAYKEITTKVLEGINDILRFGMNKLVWNEKDFILCPTDMRIEINIPEIKGSTQKYIYDLYERALYDIQSANYDSALTKARTILEESLTEALNEGNIQCDFKGDIHKLYKQVKSAYNMHTNEQADTRINKILSGLENIVTGVSELRNIDSDAHAAGRKRFNINDYHALLVVNCAAAMGEFILSVAKNGKRK